MWAQSPAWGYFSKPPLVAWLIAAAEPLCGSGPACVRAPSVLIWAAIPLIVAAIGTTLGGRGVGLWAGLCALIAPGAAFSARILSTDPPLLLFWALALLAFVRLRAGGGLVWAVVLAASIGLGLMSKYAMLYVLGGLALAALVDPMTRRSLARPVVRGAITAGLTMLVPNLLWNLDNGLVTVRHTGENLTDGGEAFTITGSVADGVEFIAAQFGLAGPVVFAAVILAAFRWRRLTVDQRLMLAFSAPIFVGVTLLAFINGANANWGAAGLIAAFVLAPMILTGRPGRCWLTGGMVFGVGIQALLLVLDTGAHRFRLPGEPYEPVLGWTALSDAVVRRAKAEGASTIVTERRGDAAQLTYGLRATGLSVRAWPAPVPGAPRDYFQMTRSLTSDVSGPVLAVSDCADPGRFGAGWARAETIQTVTVAAGPGAERTYHLIRLERPTGAIARPPSCPDV